MQSITFQSTSKAAAGALAVRPCVFVVADDVVIRESLKDVIATSGWQVEAFETAAAFLSTTGSGVPSCMLLSDTQLLRDCSVLQALRAARTAMPIVVMVTPNDVATTVRAMKGGAFDVLEKATAREALADIITAALDRSADQLEEEAEIRALRARHASLTRRERDVMALVVAGLLNKQVGGELGISEITVKAHRGQVMRKMKAESLPDLVAIATRLGVRSLRPH